MAEILVSDLYGSRLPQLSGGCFAVCLCDDTCTQVLAVADRDLTGRVVFSVVNNKEYKLGCGPAPSYETRNLVLAAIAAACLGRATVKNCSGYH
jgi:hypothetical protein